MQNGLVSALGIPDAVFARARRVARDIGRGAAELGGALDIDADEIVTGRAGLLGLAPAGRVSAGGSTRLLSTRDGWCALTLSRADDVETVPALLELAGQPTDPWAALAAAAADRDADEFVARARLLDLPAAVLGEVRPAPTRFVASGRRAPRKLSGLLVADLSSMWAGPLCGHLLAAAGATVVKVEGHGRPDGTRGGDPRFFDWMNSSKLSYAIDFRDDDLRRLLEAADVVIEGSRPAALTRRGLGPEQVRGSPRPGLAARHRLWHFRGARRAGCLRRRCRRCRRPRRARRRLHRRCDRRPADRLGGNEGSARCARARRRRNHRDRPRRGGRRLCHAAARRRLEKL